MKSIAQNKFKDLLLVLFSIIILITIFNCIQINDTKFSFNQDLTTIIKNSKPINSEESPIKSTSPRPFETNVPNNSAITIVFNKDMDSKTLNSKNILILEAQHGDRIVSDMFIFNYMHATRTLNIVFKNEKSMFPPQDGITVIVTVKVCGSDYKHIKNNFIFGYSVR